MKTFFRSIYWYLHFVITLVVMYPTILKYEKEKERGKSDENFDDKKFDEKIFQMSSKWANNQLKAAGVTVICEGQENIPEETVLFVSNHQGNFDVPVHMVYTNKPKGFIAKKSIEKFPIVNRYMHLMDCLFIDRDNIKDSAKVIIDGVKLLKQGKNLVIFPEGTRSKSSELGEFKEGAFKMATRAKVPIVPITVDGTYKIMEDNNNKIVGNVVKIFIHEKVPTDNLTKEEQAALSEKVKNIIASKLNQ